jgi:hypothetical protein
MKRTLVAMIACSAILAGTSVAIAAQRQSPTVEIQEAWTAWFLGSASANPLHTPDDSCGEVVGDWFFVAPGVTGPDVERTCEMPAGVELVTSPIGGFGNTPTDGKTDIKLFSAALGYFQGVVPKSVKAEVDGVLVPKGPATCIDAFDMDVEEGSFLDEVDGSVGASSRVAVCGWFYVIDPLTPGAHTLSFSSKFKGTSVATLTLNVTVV